MRILERLCRLLEPRGADLPGPAQAMAHTLLSIHGLWRGEWTEAIGEARLALSVGGALGRLTWLDVGVGSLLGACLALQGDAEAAEPHLQALTERLQAFPPATAVLQRADNLEFLLARLRWHQGRTGEAAALCRTLVASGPDSFAGLAAAGLLALMDGDLSRSAQAFADAAALQDQQGLLWHVSNAHIWLAYVRYRQGRRGEMLQALTPALAACAREGAPGLLLWEGRQVVAPLLQTVATDSTHGELAVRVLGLLGEPAGPAPARAEPPPDQLTEREREVLTLVADGLSNQAIADRLCLSLFTVKRHMSNISAKLGAASRTQAVARARSLGTISP